MTPNKFSPAKAPHLAGERHSTEENRTFTHESKGYV
jgi:hypothetical protein